MSTLSRIRAYPQRLFTLALASGTLVLSPPVNASLLDDVSAAIGEGKSSMRGIGPGPEVRD
ncbi:MAG: hypothetical protein VW867_01505 [Gammaproteobacteria bacterium]